MLYIAGISISFFLCLLLLSKKEKIAADYILAAWLALDGLHLYFFYLFLTGKIFNHPWLLGLSLPFPLLHGPFLFLYATALTVKSFRFTATHALHFLPAIISYVYLIPFFLLKDAEKAYIFHNKGAGYETFQLISSIAIVISGIAYVILTTVLHRKHRRKILDEFSYTDKINLDWIQYLIYGIALIWVFVILNMDNLVFGSAVFFVLFMGYFGIKQVGIFSHNSKFETPDPAKQTAAISGTENQTPAKNIEPEPPATEIQTDENAISQGIIQADFEIATRKKYHKSGLSAQAAIALHDKLQLLIETEKIFCNSELTLTDLAKKLGTHPNYLSQVINEKEGKNFYDYINTLRTEEFKRLIANPKNQKFTLLSLAFECGFNSKSSFNKYFKKVTGQSPTEYFRTIQSTEAA